MRRPVSTPRPRLNYGVLLVGIAIAGIGITMSIMAFHVLFLRSVGIALCLAGIYVTKRSMHRRAPVGSRLKIFIDRRVRFLFILMLGLSAFTYALLYVVSDDLIGTITLFSFVTFGMLTTLIGAFLLGRWTYRMLRW